MKHCNLSTIPKRGQKIRSPSGVKKYIPVATTLMEAEYRIALDNSNDSLLVTPALF